MPGAYLEGFFKPELDRVMGKLKFVDDTIRSELTGKKIGVAEAPEMNQSAKDLLKEARTNFNRREYISGISDLGMFHKKIANVVASLKKFDIDVNMIHNKFLFEGVKEDKLQKLREHMERKAGLNPEALIKEANIMDFFHNIGSKRGRGLAAWEKKYPKETKELREWGTKLVDDAEGLLANTIVYLKEMATARAIRRPDDYMDGAHKIRTEFEKFDSGPKGFKNYYATVILPFLKTKDALESEEKERLEKQKQTLEKPVTLPSGQTPSGAVTAPLVQPPQSWTPGQPTWQTVTTPGPGASIPLTPPASSSQPTSQDDGPGQEHTTLKDPKKPTAHKRFYETLESMSNEAPLILAGVISKYAKSIQESDTETAIKLFSIVKRLKG